MEEITYNIYQFIGDRFTGQRVFLFWLFIISFIIISIISFYFKINTSEDTLYWFFSSIVQSLMALVAFLGVVTIFKLQVINNSEERISNDERLRVDINFFKNEISPIGSVEELTAILNEITSKGNYGSWSAGPLKRIEETQEKISRFHSHKDFLKSYLVKFGIYTLMIVVLSLICLPLTPTISQYNIGLPILYFIIILTMYSLFLTIKGLSDSLS
jgi:hypothetical protein